MIRLKHRVLRGTFVAMSFLAFGWSHAYQRLSQISNRSPAQSSVTVNGCTYRGRSVQVLNGRVLIDGREVPPCDGSRAGPQTPCGSMRVERHVNPDGSSGGFVSQQAHVEPSVFVGQQAVICDGNFRGQGQILHTARITGSIRAQGEYVIRDQARISGSGEINGSEGQVLIGGSARISGELIAQGPAQILGSPTLSGRIEISGGSTIQESPTISGDVELRTRSTIGGSSVISGTAVLEDGSSILGRTIVSGSIRLRRDSIAGGVFSD
jgi:hypothetical protein